MIYNNYYLSLHNKIVSVCGGQYDIVIGNVSVYIKERE